MNCLRHSKTITTKRRSKQKKGAIEIVCTPSMTSLDQNPWEWKPCVNAYEEFELFSDFASDDPEEIHFTDISSPVSNDNLSPSSSYTNFFEDDVDFDFRLDSSWSLLDEIVREFHSSDDHKELAKLFDKTFLECPLPSDEIEADKSDVCPSEESFFSLACDGDIDDSDKYVAEQKEISLGSDWSMMDDIISHFSGSDMYEDVTKFLNINTPNTPKPENFILSKRTIFQDSVCSTGDTNISFAESDMTNEHQNLHPKLFKQNKGNFWLFKRDKERENRKKPASLAEHGIDISLTPAYV